MDAFEEMNEEEIKNIAKEFTKYCNGIKSDYRIEDMEDYKTAVAFVNFLQENYHIIPKNK